MTFDPYRVTFVMTHPVQYLAPWFRWIHAHVPAIQLRVLYAVQPTPAAQAAGFGGAFEWDRPLLDGYRGVILTDTASPASVDAATYSRIDVPGLERALFADSPEMVIVPGWHAAVYRHAIRLCRARTVPLVYRGDSTLQSAPSGLRGLAWRTATRRRLASYAAFLAVGTRSREYLRAHGAPEPWILDSPHAVDHAFFSEASRLDRVDARKALHLHPDRFTVLFAGKLQEKKRPLDAIRACAQLADVQLLIVGSGDLERECREEAARGRVTFAGFLNQTEMLRAYAAADCLVLPSDGRETWGLVVNEAMAAGLPAVVSDAVGCQPDLVRDPDTGAVFPLGDVTSLAAAIARVRARKDAGHDFRPACVATAKRHSFAAATTGMLAAADRLRNSAAAAERNTDQRTQVLACCGQMIVAGGMERMTFEVLAALRRSGAGVHALLNQWNSSRIVPLAQQAGVDWQTARTELGLRRRITSVSSALRMLGEILTSSVDVLIAARRVRATHVLAPDFLITVRNWPALVMLRALGCRVLLRVGMAPDQGAFYKWLWKVVVNAVVDRFVCNSEFLRREVLALGISPGKVAMIRNTLGDRSLEGTRDRPLDGARDRPLDQSREMDARRVIYIGQLIPGKGVDRLIDAVARLRGEGLPVTLDIVGDIGGWESPSYAGYHARLLALARSPDAAGAVRFLGWREDVPSLMSTAAVHCCPSRVTIREGSAGVVLEAKAAAIPSVVTQSGSLPELVDDHVDGLIVPDESSSIAEALRDFLTNAERRVEAGRAARRSLERFSRLAFETAWREEFNLSGTARTGVADEAIDPRKPKRQRELAKGA